MNLFVIAIYLALPIAIHGTSIVAEDPPSIKFQSLQTIAHQLLHRFSIFRLQTLPVDAVAKITPTLIELHSFVLDIDTLVEELLRLEESPMSPALLQNAKDVFEVTTSQYIHIVKLLKTHTLLYDEHMITVIDKVLSMLDSSERLAKEGIWHADLAFSKSLMEIRIKLHIPCFFDAPCIKTSQLLCDILAAKGITAK